MITIQCVTICTVDNILCMYDFMLWLHFYFMPCFYMCIPCFYHVCIFWKMLCQKWRNKQATTIMMDTTNPNIGPAMRNFDVFFVVNGACDYIFMLGSKLIHVNKRGPRTIWCIIDFCHIDTGDPYMRWRIESLLALAMIFTLSSLSYYL